MSDERDHNKRVATPGTGGPVALDRTVRILRKARVTTDDGGFDPYNNA